ncbi:unnamed protein product [Staurois parvus]|uniref:Peptidase S1 domain-containing protein n=1 Tax=Staurois parvus TaxID=386267 RepID=A0ABN9H6S5_9NEOB|nr:unnamed protein product [Staurois parvus]
MWVLSASQCYQPTVWIRLGEVNITISKGTEQFIVPDKVFRHRNYNSRNLDNDIMLIKLASELTLNSKVKALSLPTDCAAPGTSCLISGGGNNPSSGANMAHLPKCRNAPILTATQCRKDYQGEITDNMNCIGCLENDKDYCQAASGTPVVCNGELQGIVSRGHGQALKNAIIAYTKVCHYMDWISSIIAAN